MIVDFFKSRTGMDVLIIAAAVCIVLLTAALAWRISGISSIRFNKKTGETTVTEDRRRK